MSTQIHERVARKVWFGCAVALIAFGAPPVTGQQGAAQRTGVRVLTSMQLPEMPGMSLTVVELAGAPNPNPPSTAERHPRGHRHPGAVLVYVTQGSMRLAIEGEPVQVVPAGQTFYEPANAHHIIAENASATEPSRAIAVMLVPEGAPLTIPDPQ